MTKIKMCGLTKKEDIDAVNEWKPEYIGFVFAAKSGRFVTASRAKELRELLDPRIQAVGVFVNEKPEVVASLLNENIIDLAQLHGNEGEEYLAHLRTLTDKPLIQAFRVQTKEDVIRACQSSAEQILLDSGAGTGKIFDWRLLAETSRPFFLAGGLNPQNVSEAIRQLHPYAVDVSSGIETDGSKDKEKIAAFAAAVRKEGNL